MRVRTQASLTVAALLTVCTSQTAYAEIPLVEKDEVYVSVAGEYRMFGALTATGIEMPNTALGGLGGLGVFETPREIGTHAQLFRLGLRGDFGDWLHVEAQSRTSLSATTYSSPLGGAATGIGTTERPDTLLPLRSVFIDRDGIVVANDFDRLLARLMVKSTDITIGRQPITWGDALVFPALDLWTPFSPYDQDTSQKPGIDALRVNTSLGSRWELDSALASRGDAADFAIGALVTYYGDGFELDIGASKQWEELFGLASVATSVGAFNLRAEIAQPWDTDSGQLRSPRMTAGGTWFGGDAIIGLEYHFNGAARDEPLRSATSAQVQRGETYLLGRHYIGALSSYQVSVPFSLSFSTMINLTDPSALFAPALRWEPAQDVELSVGASLTAGASPRFESEGLAGLVPSVPTEFGLYGDSFFAQFAAYF